MFAFDLSHIYRTYTNGFILQKFIHLFDKLCTEQKVECVISKFSYSYISRSVVINLYFGFSYSNCIMAVSCHNSSTWHMQGPWDWVFFFNICLSEVHTDTPILSHFTFYKQLWGLHEYIVTTTEQSGTMQKCESFQGHQNIPNSPLSSGLFSLVFPIRLSMRLIVHSRWVRLFLCVCHRVSCFNCTPQGQSKAHSPLKLTVPVSHLWNHPIKVTRFSTAATVIKLLPVMKGLNHRDPRAVVFFDMLSVRPQVL